MGLICPHDTRMAISPQRVIRYTWCLVLGKGFQGRRIEWRYFWLYQIQDGHLGKFWMAVSPQGVGFSGHPLLYMYCTQLAVIFAIAQLSCYICGLNWNILHHLKGNAKPIGLLHSGKCLLLRHWQWTTSRKNPFLLKMAKICSMKSKKCANCNSTVTRD